VYVSDYDKECVHMLNNDGRFLRSFGQDGNDVKKLRHPVGACVIGHHVYVADHTDHCVSVFTTEGEYVTSFGQYGDSEGNFKNPSGMCMDRDGFVYVCDYANNRVQKV